MKVLEKMKKVTPDTWARTLILAITLINEFLNIVGANPIPVSEDVVYQLFSNLAVITTALLAWWKNNSFTDTAIKADKFKEELEDK